MKRWLEISYPVGVGVLTGVAVSAAVWCCEIQLPSRLSDLLPVLLNISAITTGFLGTTASIFLSISSKPIIRDMKETGEYKQLMEYLIASIRWSLVLAVISGIGILLGFSVMDWWDKLYVGVLAFVLMTAFLAFYRVMVIFSQVLRSGDSDKTGQEPR